MIKLPKRLEEWSINENNDLNNESVFEITNIYNHDTKILKIDTVSGNIKEKIKLLEFLKGNSFPSIANVFDYELIESEGTYVVFIIYEKLFTIEDFYGKKINDENIIIKCGIDILKAIKYLYKNRYIHGDIKYENIMVSDEGNFKLIDVDDMMDINIYHSYSEFGSLSYIAPEVYNGEVPTLQSEMYSLGLVLYKLANKNVQLFFDKNIKYYTLRDYEVAFYKRLSNERIEEIKNISKRLNKIIIKMCAYNKDDRYGSLSALEACLEILYLRDYIKRKDKMIVIAFSISIIILLVSLAYQYINREIIICTDENVIYSLNQKGHLRIECDNLKEDTITYLICPDEISKKKITEISIIGGHCAIQDNTFNNCLNLRRFICKAHLDEIGDNAFKNSTKLRSVCLNNDISYIGENAFYGCSNLKYVKTKSSTLLVKNNAFYGTEWYKNQNEEVVLSNTLIKYKGNKKVYIIDERIKEVSEYCFYKNYNLQTVIINASLCKVDDYAFYGCSNLKAVNCASGSYIDFGYNCFGKTDIENASEFLIINNVLLKYNGDSNSIIIPDTVKMIGKYCFAQNTSIKSVVLDHNLRIIQEYAFANCSNMEKIIFDQNIELETIGKGAFENCSAFCINNLPPKVSQIGESAFQNCSNITSIYLSNGINEIKNYTFEGCEKLKRVESVSINTIGDYAFSNCLRLSNFKNKGILIKVGKNAFLNTQLLDHKNDFIYFNNICIGIDNVPNYIDFPDKFTVIADGAFEGEENLYGINLGKSIDFIGESAFYGCSNLSTIEISHLPKYIDISAFEKTAWMDKQGNHGIIGDYYLVYNGKKDYIKLPENIRNINKNAFSDKRMVIVSPKAFNKINSILPKKRHLIIPY